jgi:hypothetical protein
MSLHAIYTKELPSCSDLEQLSLQQLENFSRLLEDEMALLTEETDALSGYAQSQAELRGKGAIGGTNGAAGSLSGQAQLMDGGALGGEGLLYGNNGDPAFGGPSSMMGAAADPFAAAAGSGPQAGSTTAGAGGRRGRGRGYRRQSVSDQRVLFLTVEEKAVLLQAEYDRIRGEKERIERDSEDAKEKFLAEVEEARARMSELRLEHGAFMREVVAGDAASAMERLLKYFEGRSSKHDVTLSKVREKARVALQQVTKAQQQLRQREDVGEALHAIDFDQLKIENHQFNERIEQKNAELVELKGTTTRTVQTLNALTERLNKLLLEQTQLRKDLRLRQEHVEKVSTEVVAVRGEGAAAQAKNAALKVQHESVKVPKVEDYIAQKSEEYELKKAVTNWRRKVEIATGHTKVMRQQMTSAKRTLGMGTAAGGAGASGVVFGSGVGAQGRGAATTRRTVGAEAVPRPPIAAAGTSMARYRGPQSQGGPFQFQ